MSEVIDAQPAPDLGSAAALSVACSRSVLEGQGAARTSRRCVFRLAHAIWASTPAERLRFLGPEAHAPHLRTRREEACKTDGARPERLGTLPTNRPGLSRPLGRQGDLGDALGVVRRLLQVGELLVQVRGQLAPGHADREERVVQRPGRGPR